MVLTSHTILFVTDQSASTEFYRRVLATEPRLEVPGMTEFELASGAVLGLMPREGAERVLGVQVDLSASARSELYLLVSDITAYWSRAMEVGAHVISEPQLRNWGDFAGYCADPDGHIIAFAEERR